MPKSLRINARNVSSAAPLALVPAVDPTLTKLEIRRSARATEVKTLPDTLNELDGGSDLSDEQVPAVAPKPKRKPRATKQNAVKVNIEANLPAEEVPTAAPPTRKRKARNPRKKAADVKSEDGHSEYADDHPEIPEPAPKKSRKRKVDPESITYKIPEVVTRDFIREGYQASQSMGKAREAAGGFVGRLGYACLNTILRQRDPPVFSSRTARIKTIEEKGLATVIDLARQNVRDIIPMLEWNAANGIYFMRLSSELLPFASHETHGYSPKLLSAELAEAGAAAKRLNMRLTMHPGQFDQLGTPNQAVLEATFRDLEMHCEILDLMGIDRDGVMIVHGGGTYGDREATLARIKTSIETRLSPSCRARLVLENDEMGYSAEELLPVCIATNTPLVFDFHHDMLRPSSQPPSVLLPLIKKIWDAKGIKPKYHLSEPRPGAKNLPERRAHSDRCMSLPIDLPPDADLMIEAKDKEQAVFELRRIYGLPVVHANLRPPAEDQQTATSGRKKAAGTTGSAAERGQALKTVEKAKAVAAKRGLKYAGPGADIDDAKGAAAAAAKKMTGADVLAQMKVEADWVRKELREGRDRRNYPGADEELQVEAAVNLDFEEEGMGAGSIQAEP